MSWFATLRTAVLFVFNAAALYVFWILFHYAAVYLYHTFCVPTTLYGLFVSPFMVVAPQCKALRWIIHTGGSVIETMWVVFGFWCVGRLVVPRKPNA